MNKKGFFKVKLEDLLFEDCVYVNTINLKKGIYTSEYSYESKIIQGYPEIVVEIDLSGLEYTISEDIHNVILYDYNECPYTADQYSYKKVNLKSSKVINISGLIHDNTSSFQWKVKTYLRTPEREMKYFKDSFPYLEVGQIVPPRGEGIGWKFNAIKEAISKKVLDVSFRGNKVELYEDYCSRKNSSFSNGDCLYLDINMLRIKYGIISKNIDSY